MAKFKIICEACNGDDIAIYVVLPSEEIHIECKACGNTARGDVTEDLIG